MACDADANLFRAVITDPGHVLHKHLPEVGQIMTCAPVLRGVNPGEVGGRDPPDFGQWGRGGRRGIVKYYYNSLPSMHDKFILRKS